MLHDLLLDAGKRSLSSQLAVLRVCAMQGEPYHGPGELVSPHRALVPPMCWRLLLDFGCMLGTALVHHGLSLIDLSARAPPENDGPSSSNGAGQLEGGTQRHQQSRSIRFVGWTGGLGGCCANLPQRATTFSERHRS